MLQILLMETYEKIIIYLIFFITTGIYKNLLSYGEIEPTQPIPVANELDVNDQDRAQEILEHAYQRIMRGGNSDINQEIQTLLSLNNADLDPVQKASRNHLLGIAYYSIRNYHEAQRLFELVINNPDSNNQMKDGANYRMGEMYFLGSGVERNYQLAKEFYQTLLNSNFGIRSSAIERIEEINRILEALQHANCDQVT